MTPTHTSRVEVPSRIPHMSYDDKFCTTTRVVYYQKRNGNQRK